MRIQMTSLTNSQKSKTALTKSKIDTKRYFPLLRTGQLYCVLDVLPNRFEELLTVDFE